MQAVNFFKNFCASPPVEKNSKARTEYNPTFLRVISLIPVSHAINFVEFNLSEESTERDRYPSAHSKRFLLAQGIPGVRLVSGPAFEEEFLEDRGIPRARLVSVPTFENIIEADPSKNLTSETSLCPVIQRKVGSKEK